ncbi:hypothetical protein DS901_05435 [Loktanella sp. D2R18]|uniref:DUF7674 family protein n=1 Tax=Rhodobacterales TaxID=204455 RepID=UPI000DEB1450|nr:MULTISPECIES: hypothetical protein [Rhodobacterales]MDO6590696.1 hypothetical protein [Yoonia sp. 1_MG-2023]RBW44682.1 hypothetical protein DS901_05435 [Loktanella sp. D2R18]
MELSEEISQCLGAFPEIEEFYSREEFLAATSFGNYVFFEDYFTEFVEEYGKSEYFFQRVGMFIETMATSKNVDTRNLAEIGVLEGLVNRRVDGVAAFLGQHSNKLLMNAFQRTKFDKEVWLRFQR